MLFKEDRKKGIGAMVVVTVAAMILLCGVVFGFYLLVHNYYSSSGPSARDGKTEEQEDTTEIIASRKDSGVAEEDQVVLVKGDIHRANRYEKVDRLSYTSTIKYRKEDLELLDSDGLRLTRNEIYARHGRMFNDQILQDYFNSQTWYSARYSPEDFSEEILNSIEKYNVDLIHSYELGDGISAAYK